MRAGKWPDVEYIYFSEDDQLLYMRQTPDVLLKAAQDAMQVSCIRTHI